MVTGTYRDLFVAIAGAAGALTGLLFVALSVAPRPRTGQQPDVIRQVRAGAALLAFTNALSVSLFGLVPHNEIGYPAIVVGVAGLLFALAGLRSILADPAARRRIRSQLALIVLLLGVFGFEIGAGIDSIANPHTDAPIDLIGNVLAASLLIGIARSWELVSDRDTGIVSSIAALAGHDRHLGGSVGGPADVPPEDAPDPRDAAGPGDAASPGDPASLGGSGAPVGPGASPGSGGPFGPGAPVGPGAPAGSGGPFGSGGPAGPGASAGSGGPFGSGGPAGPGAPAGSGGPASPRGPAGAGGPVGRAGQSSPEG